MTTPASGGAAGDAPLGSRERALLHELQGHQRELTTQNAQLREMRDALEAALARYRTLYESAPVGDLLVDPAGIIVVGNACAAALLRLPHDGVAGHRLADRVDGEARGALAAFLQQLFVTDGIHHLEATVDIPPAPAVIVALQGSREPDGRHARVILVDNTGVREAARLAVQGRALEAERRRLEEDARLAEQAREAQKMEALGVMAGGIAHDFNNHLAAILGFVAVARHEPLIPAAMHHWLDSIERAGRQASNLVRRILTFSRRSPRRLQAMALEPVVRDALRLLELSIPPGVTVDVRVAPVVPLLQGDEVELHQLVINLCTNAWGAVAATPGGTGAVTIAIGADLAGDTGQVVLTVADTGIGMDAATRARIFEPFFTTRAAGAGTGLGLAVVHGIVLAHGGTIAVDSTPGVGSTFTVRFPASPPAAPPT